MLRIREICKQQGITYAELAKRIGISKQSLSLLIIRGNPTLASLQNIASALHVEVSDLFDKKSSEITCPHCGKNILIEINKK